MPELPDEADPADAAWWREIATGSVIGGFVLAGYDVVTAYGPQPGRLLFQLAEPGPWFEQVAHTRVRTPPGNHLLFARTPALSRWEVRRARTPGAAG